MIHGSQGCSTYIRRYVISHFREPIDIASSNFSESTAIFGGGDNLKKALDNLTRQYRPEAIGIATTCLSETIGDDVRLYLDEYRRAQRGTGPMPGAHPRLDPQLQRHPHGRISRGREGHGRGPRRRRPGDGDDQHHSRVSLSAADLRHLKEIVSRLRHPFTMLPDYSETLDGESWPEYQKLSAGGTPVAAIRAWDGPRQRSSSGEASKGTKTAAAFLEERFGVRRCTSWVCPSASGRRTGSLTSSGIYRRRPGAGIYEKERGRLVDAYIDGHKYVFGKRAVIYGEVDLVAAMASFLDEIGMVPVVCATGAATGRFKDRSCKRASRHSREDVMIAEDTRFRRHAGRLPSRTARYRHRQQQGLFLSRESWACPWCGSAFPSMTA